MTIRQNAESFKQTLGTVLGLYEAYKDTTDPAKNIVDVLNVLPQSTLNQLSFLGSTTAEISTALLAIGKVLAVQFPG
jgi:hypothetical protein